MPVERWYIDGKRVLASQALAELFPQGAETLNYSPIFFRELSPGCLDTLETDWENRKTLQLGQTELYKLRAAAGADWVNEDKSGLAYIGEPYCISLTSDGGSWVMIVGIDQALGWNYVESIQVEEVSQSENGVFCKTRLLGPAEGKQGQEPSYPCIVLKIKSTDKPVQFL